MSDKAYLHGLATAVPANEITRETVLTNLDAWVGDDRDARTAVIELMEHLGVDRRFMAFSPDELLARKGIEWMNREYAARLLPLAEDATRRALDEAGLEPSDVDAVVSTSCTGFMIPALDAHLANRLGFSPELVRIPITELGCAAGASAMARAADLVKARNATVLVLTAELTSATFQLQDLSKRNLIASLLFGDGVAAGIVSGKPREDTVAITSSTTAWFPDTLEMMGFDLKETGFHLVLSPRVPAVVMRETGAVLDRLLSKAGVTRDQLEFFVLHPGGRKVLEGLERGLELPREKTQASWTVMRRFGNLSSSTVMFVLDELRRSAKPARGSRGLLAAFGPGFGAEASLLSWE